jgi:hypothetical protein
LLQLLHSVFANVRANAMIALANAIHFHESNRRRLMFEAPGSLELLVKLLNDDDVLVQAHTARCVGKETYRECTEQCNGSGLIPFFYLFIVHCSLFHCFTVSLFHCFTTTILLPPYVGAACHNDVVAKLAGEYLGLVSSLVRLLWHSNGQVQRYACFALKNLALYDPNKKRILVEGGVEGLTHCSGSNR